MNLNKKKLLSLALVLLLIGTISFGTLAWFSAADDVTNEFKIAASTQDPDDIFSIDVYEKVPDRDGDGKDDFIDVDDADDTGLYNNITPNSLLVKEPIVKNTGAYNQFVRVKVSVDNATEWNTLLNKYQAKDLSLIFEGHDPNLWYRIPSENAWDKNTDTLVYTYYLDDILEPNETHSLFTHVRIPYQFTQEDMKVFEGGKFTMKIVAEAVQSDNVGVETAHEAFALVTQTQKIG